MKNSLYLFVFACTLTACATRPEVADLVAARQPAKSFDFSRPVSYTIKRPLDPDWARTVFAGKYVATKENSVGTYYESSTKYVYGDQAGGKGMLYAARGGFWIPKSEQAVPKFFIYAAAPDQFPESSVTKVAASSPDLTSHTLLATQYQVGTGQISPGAAGAGAGLAAGVVELLAAAALNADPLTLEINNPEVTKVLLEALAKQKKDASLLP